MTTRLSICWLYGAGMNIYGDRGNVLALEQRCRWRGIEARIVPLDVGDDLKPGEHDIFFWGGGQDREQIAAAADMQGSNGAVLLAEVEDGAPLLAICGGYQLLGHYYQPDDAPRLPGIGLFDLRTEAGAERYIGNIVVDSPEFGEVVGFENHSGLTYLGQDAHPLGTVRSGYGNNGHDGTAGCRYKQAIGCYLHGALLPKNPRITDFLIQAALRRRGLDMSLADLDDGLESTAHRSAVGRTVAATSR